MDKINVGVIGLGYWGPNYVRNFIKADVVDQVFACDISEQAIIKCKKQFPQVIYTNYYEDLLNNKKINLVAIATPPETHFNIALNSLKEHKHVFIAKPMATKSTDANILYNYARERNLLLHCDFTYLYTGAVKKIKEYVDLKKIGKPIFYDSIRSNLGLVQKGVNVIWDLAPHDFSIIGFLFNFRPKSVYAVGSKILKNSKTEEMAHITINYTNNFSAHIHVSWLSPLKIRMIQVGGTEKMISFDDIQPDEKIKVYDKGIDLPKDSVTPFKPLYRNGDIFIPKLSNEEALLNEIIDILKKVQENNIDYKNTKLSLQTVQLLESCNLSIKKGKIVSF